MLLSADAIDKVARVVVARARIRSEELDQGDVVSAYEHLQTVEEARCNPDLDCLDDDTDRGCSVEYAVKRLMIGGAAVAWPLLKRIVELCPRDQDVLGHLGAGIFEDWVTESRVATVEEELRSLLRADARWRVVAEASWNEPASLVRLLADPHNLATDPL
jgi:6-phosphogluconate dehydrogenase (decarboxylating)